MWLSLSSMTARRSCPMSRLVPLGSHRRSSPLVCSLVGRCVRGPAQLQALIDRGGQHRIIRQLRGPNASRPRACRRVRRLDEHPLIQTQPRCHTGHLHRSAACVGNGHHDRSLATTDGVRPRSRHAAPRVGAPAWAGTDELVIEPDAMKCACGRSVRHRLIPDEAIHGAVSPPSEIDFGPVAPDPVGHRNAIAIAQCMDDSSDTAQVVFIAALRRFADHCDSLVWPRRPFARKERQRYMFP